MIILISSCSKNKIESDIYTVKGLISMVRYKKDIIKQQFCHNSLVQQ